ncbi:hypothetical protein HFP71_16760 [Streptomyces sp. ARC32]
MDSDHEGLMTRPGPVAHVGRVLAERLAALDGTAPDGAARDGAPTGARRTAVEAARRLGA